MDSYFTFWSNYAATDLLNLEKNEGRFFDGNLSMFIQGRTLVEFMTPEIRIITLAQSLRFDTSYTRFSTYQRQPNQSFD